ncbi:MAG: hypothetical protein WD824_09835 [Cyclobacteriaceae bacterium]
MEWIKTVVLIKTKLSQHGYNDSVSRITEAQMVLGTPGEMYLEVMNELLSIKKQSAKEYKLIEKEIHDLLDYGKSINYFNPTKEL